MNHKNCQNKGAVLIFILGIAATLSAVLVAMQAGAIQDAKRIKSYLNETEAYYLTQSGHQLAQRLLVQDMSDNNMDGATDKWYAFSEEPRTYPLAGGTIQIQIRDEGSLPNINQLYTSIDVRDPFFRDIVKRYLNVYDIDTSIINIAIDWVDADDLKKIGGAEKSTYMRKSPSYTAENKKIFSMEDIKLLDKYKPKDYIKVNKNLTVLPSFIKTNINTMNYEFLKSTFHDVPIGTLEAFNKKRLKEPFSLMHEVYQELDIIKDPEGLELDVHSRFFKLTSRASIHSNIRAFEVLYERKNGKLITRRFQWL